MKGLADLWVVGNGEGQTPKVHAILQQMNSDAVRAGCKELHLYEKYNVTGLMSPSISINKNPLTRITEAVMKGLNDNADYQRTF